ncbi:hypothetical protein PEPS_18130 [Persicobacter psychrovividus]|uniref:Uncharacterized protein n=1 Tax=Persicobacter psychrovividus TaxID=387638 RepID=A0ABM7VF16_9BACT|nr:hypothetical protein PEPS_18130 [Persicobacter psychrovividus]
MNFWDQPDDTKPPIAGTWTNLYLITIGIFIFYVLLFTLLSSLVS